MHKIYKTYCFGSTKDNCSFVFVTKKHLENINNSGDLKKLSLGELSPLAKELRDFIIDIVSVKKGHLGASLGVVELTIALHYVFDTPDDLLVWDVGHQAYPHKILTGRRELFHTNREFGGISGFPKLGENEYDAFGTGHSSTSISAALGMSIASKLKGETNKQHIAVIGDASIASGMAFEGLNHAGVADSNLLIILNDNEMGIDPNVGALKNYLTSVKQGVDTHQKNLFEALDLSYSGPIDGHNINLLVEELERLKTVAGPKLLHVITKKGKGLRNAENDQVTYHAPGPFDKVSGELISKDELDLPLKFQDVFGLTLVELAEKNKRIVGITPAMPTGSSLKYMIEKFPERAFDVGIAEQHAVTLAAGLATQGMLPFCAIYSTFLQRAYDQIIHDVALQNLPVVFCIDRAGLVGEDGPTHHGVFDIAFLSCIPNMSVFSPMDEIELRNILFSVQSGLNGPIAIRYPRGRGSKSDWKKKFETIEIGKGRTIRKGKNIAILTLGPIGEVIRKLCKKDKYLDLGHYDMRFSKPLDEDLLTQIYAGYGHIITIEEGVVRGGLGEAVLAHANGKTGINVQIQNMGIPDLFVEHGNIDQLNRKVGLDEKSIEIQIDNIINGENC
ncbi:1-deoxy-D-xylulose-5-phosphate synthase [Lutimonas halocynthiae]|uniref:1-deoxy-D-xylulose-5-phosphate synthase n=1 Tax=Lutimonas halocynthiae TaxID=1446477 RepID=UPI0025B3A525|nr:1-deoxy-D-xylulose-5-phosphate synthase [Lutimonas halocynthiae]MDN3641241.1 1-deoxy-D-xylulose-5-phosphate synthase [Lutimonas halocynthiae]